MGISVEDKMRFIKRCNKSVVAPFFAVIIATTSVFNHAMADENQESTVAFPDKWMIRLGAYIVDGTNTQFSVNSDTAGLGTTLDYQRDLGGEDSATIPRIDAYFRFNEKHRIDFTTFSINRKGERTLALDFSIGDEDYHVSETLNSEVKYSLYRLGYNYSFYHSPKVELSMSAGLNITSYDLEFSNDSGSKYESAGITAPLPVFGLRMGYAITPKWFVHYVTEAFFIEINDSFRGSLVNYELNTEYKLFKHFAIGAGLARIGINAEIDDDDWRGEVKDAYRGYTVFGTFYF